MSNIKIYKEILNHIEKRKKFVLLTILDTKGKSAGKVGRKMIVTLDKTIGSIGGGTLEWEAIKVSRKIINDNKDVKVIKEISTLEDGCGGKWKVFFEYFTLQERLIIFGAGHVAKALYDVMSTLDFEILIIDDREYLLLEDRFKEAKLVNSKNLNIDDIKIDENTYAVVATKGHETDENVIMKLLDKKLKYIGLIGSKSKIENINKSLKTRNINILDYQNVYAPIGLSVATGKPTEIAIGIAAEILSVKNNTEVSHMRDLMGLGDNIEQNKQ